MLSFKGTVVMRQARIAYIAILSLSIIGLLGAMLLQSFANQKENAARLYALEFSLEEQRDALSKVPVYPGRQLWAGTWESAAVARAATADVSVSRGELEAQISTDINELRSRLADIEKRFPSDATVDKVASVNDALLAKSIEDLGTSITEVKTAMLDEWDVAKIVFAVLGGMGTLVGIFLAAAAICRTKPQAAREPDKP